MNAYSCVSVMLAGVKVIQVKFCWLNWKPGKNLVLKNVILMVIPNKKNSWEKNKIKNLIQIVIILCVPCVSVEENLK